MVTKQSHRRQMICKRCCLLLEFEIKIQASVSQTLKVMILKFEIKNWSAERICLIRRNLTQGRSAKLRKPILTSSGLSSWSLGGPSCLAFELGLKEVCLNFTVLQIHHRHPHCRLRLCLMSKLTLDLIGSHQVKASWQMVPALRQIINWLKQLLRNLKFLGEVKWSQMSWPF